MGENEKSNNEGVIMRKIRRFKARSGFTLVELLIVIAILAVLVGIFGPLYLRYVERSRQTADIQVVATVVGAMRTTSLDPLYERHMRGVSTITFTWNTTSGDVSLNEIRNTGGRIIDPERDTAVENSVKAIVGRDMVSARSNSAGLFNVKITYTVNNGKVEIDPHTDEAFEKLLDTLRSDGAV
jgi:prepilin-type N-terminal cleavage/methylation domain-containing protein